MADRIRLREISANDLIDLRDWLDTGPEIPKQDWFKSFDNFFICREGSVGR